MPKYAAGPPLALLCLDRASPIPLHRQLYQELRAAILAERIRFGERLPSTRTLARELGVSRRTVLDAFLQLYAEGYVDGKVGAGTFVAYTRPEGQGLVPPSSPLKGKGGTALKLSERFLRQQNAMPSSLLGSSPPAPGQRAFLLGTPALDAFPTLLWGRLMARLGRHCPNELLSRHQHAGYRPLREAIAAYLGMARGVQCTADQVMIVNGSQQALSLIAQVLLNPGDSVWMEEPGYFGAKGALLGADADLVPVPVDHEGLDVAAGQRLCAGARLAFVTPSHQMPLGVTMSLPRRLALLEWARAAEAWVVEDDYDSEFRYTGRPLAALQGLDSAGRVLYTGTFSKVLYPGLRLGYLVVPPALMEAFMTARFFTDLYSPLMEQLLVTEFIQSGHFERHIRRMRSLYAERQSHLVKAAKTNLAGQLELAPADSGMHLLGKFLTDCDDCAVAYAAHALGVRVIPLSRQYLGAPAQSGLLFGYAAVPPDEITLGIQALARALSTDRQT
jgi:GntR family transcriptional regulator/MocR family aminotransferase